MANDKVRRILLSTIPDDFNKEKDILMGPWCFYGKEHIYSNWESLKFEDDPFKNIDEIAHHAKITTDFANAYINKLSNMLNQTNNTNHSVKFWRLITFPWLLTLIQTTWERQCRVNNFIKKYKDMPIELNLLKNNISWRFSDTADFINNGILNPVYNEWLFSRLLESKIPPIWKIKWEEKSFSKARIVSRERKLKHKLLEFYSNHILSSTVYGIGRIEAIFWESLLYLKSLLKSEYSEEISEKYNNVDLKWNLNWEDLVSTTLPELFRDIKRFEKKNNSKKTNRLFMVGPVLWYNEKIKFKLAYHVENGGKIIVSQHGGNYGNAKVYPFPSEIEYKHFTFFSWGWNKQENYFGNIIALPSPYMSKFNNKHKKKNDKLVLIGTRAHLFSYRLDSVPQPLEQIYYRNAKRKFLLRLRENIFNSTLYRPYFNDIGSLKDQSYFEELFPNMGILKGNLHKQILKCKLIVLDHPGTTLNFAIAANIPIIGFWNGKAWAMCRQAEPFFSNLKKAGILWETGHQAAQKVNEIWDNVDEWWNQPKIQKARKEWAWNYTRTSKHWRRDWIKAIWNL